MQFKCGQCYQWKKPQELGRHPLSRGRCKQTGEDKARNAKACEDFSTSKPK